MLEISIITPSLNYGRYLEDCIRSVDAQRKWHNCKLNHVIMDGGSKDETLAVLLQNQDKVNYFINNEEGQTAALNHGMQIVEDQFPNTTYIGWINADDVYKDFWLDVMYEALSQEPPDVGLICSDVLLYGELGSGRTTWGLQRYFDKRFLALYGNCIPQLSVLIRYFIFRKLKEKHGFYFNPDFDYCQDFELWCRFLDDGYRIRHLPKITANLRMHPRQLSRICRPQQIAERDFLMKRICAETNTPLPTWYGR